MLADQLDYVVGVDPHRDAHALAIVETRTGVVVFEAVIARGVQIFDLMRPGRVRTRGSGRRGGRGDVRPWCR